MGKNVYTSEIKWAVVKEKLSGQLTTKEIMEKYGIKNKSQGESENVAPSRLNRNFSAT